MKAFVIGSGGREHALAWKLQRSPSITEVFACPGNPGIAQCATCFPQQDYLTLAEQLGPDFTVVGPEAPLVNGTVDRFRASGMPIVGPTAECAQLEGSKLYSKRFMESHSIPTARFKAAVNREEAMQAIRTFDLPLVLKTDGLAAGKGVVIVQTAEEAANALEHLAFPIVVEEFLVGEEVSFIVLSDGKTVAPFEPSQDHKTVFDGDTGPNTGGMGAYSDARILDHAQRTQIMERVIAPVIAATAFTGFLYAGLMMTAAGPKVLEFNVRMGDPETQPLLMRLQSDFGEALFAAATGALRPDHFRWYSDPATCVVLASAGYPGEYSTGVQIHGLEAKGNATVFQAGTKRTSDGNLVTSGGRVLGVTAMGKDLVESIQNAYSAVSNIQFSGMHYRKDIGAKGLRRYNVGSRARSSDG